MAKHVRIVLDTGTVLPPKNTGQTYIDVGFFDPRLAFDFELHVDGRLIPVSDGKLAKNKEQLDIQHLDRDKNVKAGVRESGSFRKDLLRVKDLYGQYRPTFKDDEFDCILRFHSGDFDGHDVRSRCFKECVLADESHTGQEKHQSVANDLAIDYQLEEDEVLQILRGKDEVFSTEKVGKDASRIVIRILNDVVTAPMYFKAALELTGVACCWLPNPDPPPMND